MIEILRSTRVRAPVESVWALVDDLDALAGWFSFAERFEIVDGSGVGRLQRMHGRWGKKRSEIDQRVVALEPERLLAWEHQAERLEGKAAPKFAASTRFSIELAPADGGTNVTLRSQQEPASVLKGLVMKMFGTKEVAQHLEASLAALKDKADR